MKKSVIAAATAAAVLAAGGSIVYATGTYDDWRDTRALDDACRGMVDASEVQKVLGADRVSGKKSGGAGCLAYDPGGTKVRVAISVQRGRDAEWIKTNSDMFLTKHPAEMLVPVGRGWPALVSAGTSAGPYATAFLPCGKGADNDLVLNLTATRAESAGSTQDRRDGMAVLVTRALDAAAKEQGCAQHDSSKVHSAPSDAFKDLTKAGTATGTCQGINSPSYESAADTAAPIEQCLTANAAGVSTFRLAAYYGPYTNAPRRNPFRSPDDYVGTSGSNEGKSWTTASCPTGTALYTLEPVDSHATAGAGERRALLSFAARSAERHGCGTPAQAISE
ncbi:hypothetical protein OOK13_25005 [Streptomyces sp. NBC_00378]|uniref:hypothetical protein n=1 Tax=unclassified Streptomyces TaxID=2593676 RepID=UPI0022596EC6|nr:MULTISPECIES: hypothetical protein [unclassified Streptomyces]MCX5111745.1 hypothetical protein [Streptomyces sp. NBC_00378]